MIVWLYVYPFICPSVIWGLGVHPSCQAKHTLSRVTLGMGLPLMFMRYNLVSQSTFKEL